MKTKKTKQNVILSISVNAHSAKRNELLSAFQMINSQTLKEKGCLGCRLSQDIDNENLIYLEETWEHRSQLDVHLRSDLFSALIGSVEFLGEKHEIHINDFSGTKGWEAVQSVRSKDGTGGHL